MRFRHLDLNLIIYLDALLAERSVSRAAERVHISQSAMSDALARLRVYFQDKLFVQVGRSMVPTPLAASMLQPIRDILLQVESVATTNVQFDPRSSRRNISILASDYVTDVLLNRALLRMSREAPGITVEIRHFTGSFVQDFEQGNLDLLITPRGYATERHLGTTLYTEDFVCVVWKGNRKIGKSLSFDQYKSLGHIRVTLGDWRISTYDEWFLKHRGDVRRIELVVPSFRMALQFVTGTERVLTCHRRHARIYVKQYDLKLVKAPFDIPPIELQMQWHKYRDQDPALAWFRELLQSEASQI
jgi:LysR family transcriptional regulator, nod-box dependent transcriptional activator